jgi:hypothetical protein
MLKLPVLLSMLIGPAPTAHRIPSAELAGAMFWVRLLMISVVVGGTLKSVPALIPPDWLPLQVTVTPDVVHASGPAAAGCATTHSALAATVPSNAARRADAGPIRKKIVFCFIE